MIGVFDSGHGGLTVFGALVERFPAHDWLYYGDHANAPYGDCSNAEVVELTKAAVAKLFMAGCKLVILGCNTATAVAGRSLQQEWLPMVNAKRAGHRILGIIAPTVEAVTQTPWSVKVPVFPQKYNTDTYALFATGVTVRSGVYEAEIAKRCPKACVVSLACPKLVPLIEAGGPAEALEAAVAGYVAELLAKSEVVPQWAILGCTHFPLIQDVFARHLPPQVRIVNQPQVVADALEDYLDRHPEVLGARSGMVQYFTSGEPEKVGKIASKMLGKTINFGRF